MVPSERMQTSFGLLSSLPSKCEASTSRRPSGACRTRLDVACSQMTRFRSASQVMPLHLFDGRMTSRTPPASSHRRRTSPGMSENSR